VQLGHLDAFIPISQTLIFVNDLITSALLISLFAIVRWRAPPQAATAHQKILCFTLRIT